MKGQDDSWSVSTYTESVNEEEAVDANPYNIANSGPGHDLREDYVHIDADHVYKGLIFTVLACKTDEAVDDSKPTDHRLKQVAITDELLHKISGNEHRGNLAAKRAIASLQNQLLTSLSTIVDYAGFRVQVVCPVDVHADSLVYDGVLTVGDPEKVVSQREVHELVGSVLSELNISLGPPLEGQTPTEDSDGRSVPDGVEVHEDENGDKYLLNLSKTCQ